MEKKIRDSFVFYRSWAVALKKLSPAQRNKALWAIIDKALDDEEPGDEAPGAVKAAVAFAAPLLEASEKRYEEKRQAVEYGKLGGRPKKEKAPKKAEPQGVGAGSEEGGVSEAFPENGNPHKTLGKPQETLEAKTETLENPLSENLPEPPFNVNENGNGNGNGKEKENLTSKLGKKKGEEKVGRPLEERQAAFWQEVCGLAAAKPYGEKMKLEFYTYWSEPNHNNSRMRWELERTWSTAGRMSTWAAREDKMRRPAGGYGGVTDPGKVGVTLSMIDPDNDWEERLKRW